VHADIAKAATPEIAKGAVVVALGDDVTDAAKPLVRSIYQDTDLRPGIDEPTARVLVGEPPAEGASATLKDLAELRASIARAGSDSAERRLLGSIGTELHAAVVLAVSNDGGRPHARILRVSTGTFSGTDLGATITRSETGAVTYAWPGAAATVHGFLTPIAPKPIPAPAPPSDAHHEGFAFSYRSPWFWAGLGLLSAVGVSVLVISKVEAGGSAPGVHVTGSVPP
jgi:hypothetical protein